MIPLSPNSGLIQWIPNTDTLHALIKEYRFVCTSHHCALFVGSQDFIVNSDARKVLLNIEHRLMLQMAPDYQLMTLIQKVSTHRVHA